MASKKTVVTEVASALGAAAARVESLKPKRPSTTKHAKAQPVPQPVAPAEPEVVLAVPTMTEREEIELVAYLYSEARGFQGGSQEEDWVRAEYEVAQRRAAKR